MGSSVKVLSVETLQELKAAIERFGTDALLSLNSAEQEITMTQVWLQERQRHWQNQVLQHQDEVASTSAALARCESSGYRDEQGSYHAPDCSHYQQALNQVRIRLQEAEYELSNVQQWMKRVEAAVNTYQAQSRRMTSLMGSNLPRSTAFLMNKIAALQSYLSLAGRIALHGPSLSQKRKAIERSAEAASRSKLYRTGYQSVHRMQHDSIHGVDLGAIKLNKHGHPVAGAVVEVKGRSGLTPGPSSFKSQVRSSYYMPRLLKAKRSGVKGASQLYRLAKAGKVVSFGATYGQQGLRFYRIPRRGPIPRRKP